MFLELAIILLPLPPKCGDYIHEPLCLVLVTLNQEHSEHCPQSQPILISSYKLPSIKTMCMVNYNKMDRYSAVTIIINIFVFPA